MLPIKEKPKGHFTLHLPVHVDFEIHQDFRETLREIISHQPKELTLDFDEVEYVDSAGLGMLMLTRQEAKTNKCELAIANLREGHPKKVLEMVKFDELFSITYK